MSFYWFPRFGNREFREPPIAALLSSSGQERLRRAKALVELCIWEGTVDGIGVQ